MANGFIGDASDTLANIALLLERGADPTIADNFGNTASDYARRSGNEDIVNLLSAAAEAYAAP